MDVDVDGDDVVPTTADEVVLERLTIEYRFVAYSADTRLCIGSGTNNCYNLITDCDAPRPASPWGNEKTCTIEVDDNPGLPSFVDHPDDWDQLRLITSGSVSRL